LLRAEALGIVDPRDRTRNQFSEIQDKALQQLYKKHHGDLDKIVVGMKRWQKTKVQCRQRLKALMSSTEPWTLEEEEKLLEAYRQFGYKWSALQKCVPWRSYHAVRNFVRSARMKQRIAEI
jgi:hypothetical protein